MRSGEFQPHDLLWLIKGKALISPQPLPDWVDSHWTYALPVVVRRDSHTNSDLIPIGIRGPLRNQRAAAWVDRKYIAKYLTPEQLITQLNGVELNAKPIAALIAIAQRQWPWRWGVTGSCAYTLASGQNCLNDNSDLDLLIRCPTIPNKSGLFRFSEFIQYLPCRVDVQLQTPSGACALSEWLKGDKVLLKTNQGVSLVTNPWHEVNNSEDAV